MTDPLLLTVLVAAFALATLVFVMVLVAVRADQQTTIRGPMADLDELERRIATKKETLIDLDADLEKRREALADFARIQADADALSRQLDELQVEWGQHENRRQEVLALRQETEEAQVRFAEATRDLDEKTAELGRVEVELEEARRLISELDAMTRRQAELEATLADLRSQVSELESLRAREDALRAQLPALERDAAQVQGEIEALARRRDEAAGEAATVEQRLGTLRADISEVAAEMQAHPDLADAIRESTEASTVTGQFVWRGVSRT